MRKVSKLLLFLLLISLFFVSFKTKVSAETVEECQAKGQCEAGGGCADRAQNHQTHCWYDCVDGEWDLDYCPGDDPGSGGVQGDCPSGWHKEGDWYYEESSDQCKLKCTKSGQEPWWQAADLKTGKCSGPEEEPKEPPKTNKGGLGDVCKNNDDCNDPYECGPIKKCIQITKEVPDCEKISYEGEYIYHYCLDGSWYDKDKVCCPKDISFYGDRDCSKYCAGKDDTGDDGDFCTERGSLPLCGMERTECEPIRYCSESCSAGKEKCWVGPAEKPPHVSCCDPVSKDGEAELGGEVDLEALPNCFDLGPETEVTRSDDGSCPPNSPSGADLSRFTEKCRAFSGGIDCYKPKSGGFLPSFKLLIASLIKPVKAAPSLPAITIVVKDKQSGKQWTFNVGTDGKFNFKVPGGKSYQVTISAPGYQEVISDWNPDKNTKYWMDVELKRSGQGEIKVEEQTGVAYYLSQGWNLITPSVQTNVNAQQLLDLINQSGGSVSLVNRWLGDHWQPYVLNLSQEPFKIEPGEGYALMSGSALSFNWPGEELDQEINYQFRSGWNLVGFPGLGNKSAQDLMGLLGESKVSEIDRWQAGNWQPFIVKQFDDGTKQYGENFPLSSQEGYFIKAEETFNWSN